jgi:hypothetical protein
MELSKIIIGAVTILIGIILLPVVAWFIYEAKYDWNLTSWNGSAWVSDPRYVEDTNMSNVNPFLNLILYGFAFALVGTGIGMIWLTLKE